MDLGRAVKRFSTNTIEKYNFDFDVWEDTGVTGSIQTYDRFISDRAFGQTKRNLLTPWDERLDMDSAPGVFRFGGLEGTQFLLESLNKDTVDSTTYNNIYMIHELAYPVVIKKSTGHKRASGSPKRDIPKVVATTWGDYSRYTAKGSKEIPTADYTIINLAFPRGTAIDTDCTVEMDGQTFSIDEISYSLNSMICKAQQLGGKFVPPVSSEGYCPIPTIEILELMDPSRHVTLEGTALPYDTGLVYESLDSQCKVTTYRVDAQVVGYDLTAVVEADNGQFLNFMIFDQSGAKVSVEVDDFTPMTSPLTLTGTGGDYWYIVLGVNHRTVLEGKYRLTIALAPTP